MEKGRDRHCPTRDRAYLLLDTKILSKYCLQLPYPNKSLWLLFSFFEKGGMENISVSDGKDIKQDVTKGESIFYE